MRNWVVVEFNIEYYRVCNFIRPIQSPSKMSILMRTMLKRRAQDTLITEKIFINFQKTREKRIEI